MNCPKCQVEVKENLNFCNKCGTRINFAHLDNYQSSVTKTKVFFFIQLGYIVLLRFFELENSYITTLITDLIFAAIVITFFIINFRTVSPILFPKQFNYWLTILVFVFFSLSAVAVSRFGDFLNQDIFNVTKRNYFEEFINSPSPLLLCIISIGVFPAIFEEIAFRGILFNELRNIISVNATVTLTAVLFTIMHLNIIGVIWLLPAGLIFGYLRKKYDCLFYGVLGHFTYNSSLVLIEYFSL